jgi:hypothetical protein
LAAATTLPFILLAMVRRGPTFLAVESPIAVALVAAAGIFSALTSDGGIASALIAGTAALSLLLTYRRFAGLPGMPADMASLLARLSIPGFAAAAATSVFVLGPIPGWPAASLVVPTLTLAVLAFFAVAIAHRGPEFFATDSVVLLIAIVVIGLGHGLGGQLGAPSAIAAAICALALLVPVHERTFRARWLSLPLFLCAFSVLYLRCPPDPSLAPPEFFVLATSALLAPFFLAVLFRGGPDFLRSQLLIVCSLLACLGLAQGIGGHAGGTSAQAAGTAALAALGMGLGLGRKASPGVARLVWIAVPLLCPIAVVPLADVTVAWPAAIVAAAAVAVLCVQSKRRLDPLMGAIAISVGLVALAWVGLAAAKPFSHGGNPIRHFPILAIVIAAYGMAMGHWGQKISAATAGFMHWLETLTVIVGEAVLLLGIGLRPEPSLLEALAVVLGFGVLSCAAVSLAFRSNRGWPFYIADTALGFAYGYLRVRTGWLDGVSDLDGLASCILAFVNLGIARTLQRWKAGLGATESQLLANLLPLLAPLFLQIGSPVRAVGTFAAAATYALLARQQKRPLLGWAAGILANIAMVPLWLHYQVHSPMAFALPTGATLALPGRIYDDRLGKQGPLVRSLASLLVFGATSYQVFEFSSPWPALVLAVCAITAVLLGIAWRARAYLYLGFAALLLDILGNLTRWGMADRLRGAVFGLAAGMALLVFGVLVARHKNQLLERFRAVQGWS